MPAPIMRLNESCCGGAPSSEPISETSSVSTIRVDDASASQKARSPSLDRLLSNFIKRTTPAQAALRFAAVAAALARRLKLRTGEIACEISGSDSGQLAIGIPGLSANLRCFDVIFDALDGAHHRKLAFDPRGRGRSSDSGPGTYGWPSHARDVIEMADQLGSETFDVIGWSMGVWIAMVVAQMAPQRVRRVVLIDAAGLPEESVKVPVYAGLDRLATVFPSRGRRPRGRTSSTA